MARKSITISDAVDMEMASIQVVATNLLVKNKNFESGYYATNVPMTSNFIRQVLPLWHDAIIEKVGVIREMVKENMVELEEALDRLERIEKKLAAVPADQLAALGLVDALSDARGT